MPTVATPVWTSQRKLLGNVVPGVLSFPLAIAGVFLWRPEDPFAVLPLALLLAFPIAGWVMLGIFGLWGNAAMRDELGRKFGREHGRPETPLIFVGVATPKFRSILDPHEDVAFLQIQPESLFFYGDATTFELAKSDIQGFKLAPNTHSILILGGWIVIETSNGKTLVEPRQKDTLWGNRKFRKQLIKELTEWKNTNFSKSDEGALKKTE